MELRARRRFTSQSAPCVFQVNGAKCLGGGGSSPKDPQVTFLVLVLLVGTVGIFLREGAIYSSTCAAAPAHHSTLRLPPLAASPLARISAVQTDVCMCQTAAMAGVTCPGQLCHMTVLGMGILHNI